MRRRKTLTLCSFPLAMSLRIVSVLTPSSRAVSVMLISLLISAISCMVLQTSGLTKPT
jgi:hypothetical protein